MEKIEPLEDDEYANVEEDFASIIKGHDGREVKTPLAGIGLVLSRAWLPSRVVEGLIIEVPGLGLYKGINGVWVPARNIRKFTQIFSSNPSTEPNGRGISNAGNTTVTLSQSYLPFSDIVLYGDLDVSGKSRDRKRMWVRTYLLPLSGASSGGLAVADRVGLTWSVYGLSPTRLGVRDRGSIRMRRLNYIDGVNYTLGWHV